MDTEKPVATNERLTAKYEALLKAAGFELIHVWEGVIMFKLISYAYSLNFQPDLPEYLSFGLGAAIDPSKNKETSARYELAQFINSSYRYVKCHFETDSDGDDSIQFACDLMFVNESDFIRCAHTAVKTLDNAYISASAKFPDVV
ncbi:MULTISPECIES: hypothetical protein [unclassified Pseudomonas]|uniref:hypothetical protein n=1 Tax=unclassified Pseudomonas TaxID=196821 RepID=UPI00244B43CF|nr:MULTISPECIES: hypothetical protein [unclassified Pseudomonas]MDG9926237.1 hypothetical protein [Pseudomonas sp. GD04045]MDH0037342.1 hypothetical protein [Pseudomonas sp. GD04019]